MPTPPLQKKKKHKPPILIIHVMHTHNYWLDLLIQMSDWSTSYRLIHFLHRPKWFVCQKNKANRYIKRQWCVICWNFISLVILFLIVFAPNSFPEQLPPSFHVNIVMVIKWPWNFLSLLVDYSSMVYSFGVVICGLGLYMFVSCQHQSTIVNMSCSANPFN